MDTISDNGGNDEDIRQDEVSKGYKKFIEDKLALNRRWMDESKHAFIYIIADPLLPSDVTTVPDHVPSFPLEEDILVVDEGQTSNTVQSDGEDEEGFQE